MFSKFFSSLRPLLGYLTRPPARSFSRFGSRARGRGKKHDPKFVLKGFSVRTGRKAGLQKGVGAMDSIETSSRGPLFSFETQLPLKSKRPAEQLAARRAVLGSFREPGARRARTKKRLLSRLMVMAACARGARFSRPEPVRRDVTHSMTSNSRGPFDALRLLAPSRLGRHTAETESWS